MADSKITDLTLATSITGDDVLPIVNGGSTKKVTVTKIKEGLATTTYVDTQDALKYDASNPSGYQTAGQVQTIADAKVVQTITNGVTATAPSQDAVFDALATKQATLVSATNIKTINGTTILGSGDLVVSGGGSVTLSPIGAVPNANAATLTGSVLNLQPASASFGGVVTTGDQTFAGAKTFSSIKFGATGVPTFFEYIGSPFLTGAGGVTFNIGGGPGVVQNNLAVPNGTFNIGLQTASTIASFDANKNVVSLPLATYPSLTELALLKGVTGSSVQTQLNAKVTSVTGTAPVVSSGGATPAISMAAATASVDGFLTAANFTTFNNKQDKSLSAYSVVANNTASSANAAEFTFRKWDKATYGGTIAWNGTAPTTILGQSYGGQQVGNMVSINLSIVYSVAGATNTQVTFTLPSDLPTPVSPTGFTAALDVIAYGTGMIMNATNSTAVTGARNCFLRRNAANNGYEFFLNVSISVSAKVAILNLTYQTS